MSGAWLRLDACGADADLVGLARDCLSAEREGRPRDAGAVAGRLTGYLAGVQERLRVAEVARAAESARAEEATRTAEAERRARRLTAVLAACGVGLIALVGWGIAWLQRQDAMWAATTSRLVNAALVEAARREGEARAGAGADPAPWDAALAEARGADALLRLGRADAALRGRVDAILADLTRQRREAEARAAQIAVNRKLLADLDAARTELAPDFAEVDRGYVAAFKAAGLDADHTEPRAIGEWIAARPARSDLVVYLDDWARLRGYATACAGPPFTHRPHRGGSRRRTPTLGATASAPHTGTRRRCAPGGQEAGAGGPAGDKPGAAGDRAEGRLPRLG